MNERRWNLLAACVVSTVGLIIAGLTIGSWWAMVGLSIATFGFYGSKGPFWSMPPMFLTGTAAAASIAWINSIGNLGGFFGPWYVGVMKDMTGSYAGGLYGLAFWAWWPRWSRHSACTSQTLPPPCRLWVRLRQRNRSRWRLVSWDSRHDRHTSAWPRCPAR